MNPECEAATGEMRALGRSAFRLTDLVILALIWLERGARKGRWVSPVMLSLSVQSQLPAVLGLTGSCLGQALPRWSAALPSTEPPIPASDPTRGPSSVCRFRPIPN